MRFSPCACRAEHYQRVRRSAWMRLMGSRRLYRCLACNSLLFIRPDQAVGSLYADTVIEPTPPPARPAKTG